MIKNPFKQKAKKVKFSTNFKGANITHSQTARVNKPECDCDCKVCKNCTYTFKK